MPVIERAVPVSPAQPAAGVVCPPFPPKAPLAYSPTPPIGRDVAQRRPAEYVVPPAPPVAPYTVRPMVMLDVPPETVAVPPAPVVTIRTCPALTAIFVL